MRFLWAFAALCQAGVGVAAVMFNLAPIAFLPFLGMLFCADRAWTGR